MSEHERAGGRLAGASLTVALPFLFAGNALVVLLIPWFADLQYALPGFPDDPIGLTAGERIALAREGVRSIWPVGPGPDLLRSALLPSGTPAYTPGEVAHMDDVRSLVRWMLGLWLVAAGLAVASFLTLGRRGDLEGRRVAFRRGAIATFAGFGLVAVLAVISFDFFFTGFHDLFFAEGSWTFASDSTLISLYPERFWAVATASFVVLTLGQAVVAWLAPGGAERG